MSNGFYSERGSNEDLGIQKTEKQQNFNVKPQFTSAAPALIDILHRLLWLAEKKPQDIPNFLALAMPDANQLRLFAQALAGRTLISNNSVVEPNKHKCVLLGLNTIMSS